MYILHKNLQKKRKKYTQKGKYSPFQERIKKTTLQRHIKKIELEIFLNAGKIHCLAYYITQ